MLKGIVEKALSTVLVAAIIGLFTLMYNEFETYKELKTLIDVRHELESAFIKEVKHHKTTDSITSKRIQAFEIQHKKDSTDLKYCKEWVNYWVSLR
jgi:hypothetical protein